MLPAAAVLLLNVTLAPAMLADDGPPGASLTDGLPFTQDPALEERAPPSPDAGSANGTDAPSQAPSVLPESGPVRPTMPDLPGPVAHIGIPCLVVMGDVAGLSACPSAMLDAVLPPRPKVAAEANVTSAPPAASTGIDPAPVRQAMDQASLAALAPRPFMPAPAAHAPPAGDAAPRGSGGAPPAGTASSALAWFGATAGAGAAALLLLKLLATFVVRRRRTSPRREALMDLVRAEPGIHHTELVRRTGFGNGAVQHHLRALAEDGLVVPVRTAGHTCFFPGGLEPALVAVRVALRAPTTRQVLALLVAQPRRLSALARQLGLPVTTVHYHVDKLTRAGALERVPSATGLALAATGLGCRALAAGQQADVGVASGQM